jgi:HPr kinase/phosphorylase
MKSSDASAGPSVAIRDLLREQGAAWGLELIAGRGGLSRRVRVPRVQKPGLALAGSTHQVHPDRVQVIGNPELAYLKSLPAATARRAIARICRGPVACFIVANGQDPPKVLMRAAAAQRIPLLRTGLGTGVLIRAISGWLAEKLSPRITVHGVLVQVFGLGVLIAGKSGVGKSEAALDLITRGHRLVADDIVEVAEISPLALHGRCPEAIQHHMEIRGLGIINVRDLYGTLATLDQHTIDLVVELIATEADSPVEHLGLDEDRFTLLNVAVPLVRLPVTPGRYLATLVEAAVRNQILKTRGYHGAREFAAQVQRRIDRARGRGVA